MSKKTRRAETNGNSREAVSPEMLEMYHNAQQQLQAAQVAAQFVTQQIGVKYKLGPFDTVNLATGEIARGESREG